MFFDQKRLIVYGDIHGCLSRFRTLREKLAIRSSDTEICVGDLVNKGSQIIELLNFVMDNEILSVRGNNEQRLLNVYNGSQKINSLSPLERQIYKDLKPKHWNFLENLPFFLRFDAITIVHAGLKNDMDLDNLSNKQKQEVISMRAITHNDKTSFWSDFYDGDNGFVVFGHQASNNPIVAKFAIGIDTGCVYGGKLTAAIFKNTKKTNYTLVSL